MYLLYLRCKAFLIRHKLIIRIIFGANVSFLLTIFIIGIRNLIYNLQPSWLFGYPLVISGALLAPIVIISEHLKLNDIQKKILCCHLKTGYNRCDQIIDIIIKEVRKRKTVIHFVYKELEVSGLYINTVDEPIIDPTTINGVQLTPLIIYPMNISDGDNWLYLREFLVSYTDSPLDYAELEKSFIQHLA